MIFTTVDLKLSLFIPFLLLVVVNIGLGLFMSFKKDYNSRLRIIALVLGIVLLLYLCLIVYLDHDNFDYNSYLSIYSGKSKYGEEGFVKISKFCFEREIPFDVFRLMFFVASIGSLYVAMKILSVNENIVLGLFSLFSLGMDGTQIRNFFAYSTIILGIVLVFKFEKFNKLWSIPLFILIVYLSSSIHTISVLYFIFLLPFLTIKKRPYFYYAAIVLSLTITTLYFVNNDLNVSVYIFERIPEQFQKKLSQYMTMKSQWHYLASTIIQLMALIGSRFIYIGMKENNSSSKDLKIMNFLVTMIGCILVLTLTCQFSKDFYRIVRNGLVLLFMVLSLAYKGRGDNKFNTYTKAGISMVIIAILSISLFDLSIDGIDKIFFIWFN